MQMEVTGKAGEQVCLLAESIYSGIIKGYVVAASKGVIAHFGSEVS